MREKADETVRKVAGESVMADEGVRLVVGAAEPHAGGQSSLLLGEPRHLKVEDGKALRKREVGQVT